jgi:hypothetical protein
MTCIAMYRANASTSSTRPNAVQRSSRSGVAPAAASFLRSAQSSDSLPDSFSSWAVMSRRNPLSYRFPFVFEK